MKYGLANPLTAMPAERFSFVVNSTRFGDIIGSRPEGIMYAKVQTVEECLQMGGIFLREQVSGRWMFLVGRTLADAMSSGTLGKVLSNSVGGSVVGPVVERSRRRGKSYFSWSQAAYAAGNYGYFDLYGLNLSQGAPVVADFFTASANVEFCGVFCGADDGFGVSHNVNVRSINATDATCPTYSYMRSLVAMRTPFGVFLDRSHRTVIDAAPGEVQEYYLRTYNQAKQPYAALRPELALLTVWKNGQLVDKVPKNVVLRFGNGTTYEGNALQRGDRIPQAVLGYAHESVTAVQYASGNNGQDWSYVGTYGGGSYSWAKTVATTHEVVGNLGKRYSALPHAPMVSQVQSGTVLEVPNLTGVVDGFAIGQVRDGHVVYRALHSGLRYANDAPSHLSVDAYVNALFPELFTNVDDGLATAVDNELAAAAVLASSRFGDDAFGAGPLVAAVSSFLDRWDNLARDLARAEN